MPEVFRGLCFIIFSLYFFEWVYNSIGPHFTAISTPAPHARAPRPCPPPANPRPSPVSQRYRRARTPWTWGHGTMRPVVRQPMPATGDQTDTLRSSWTGWSPTETSPKTALCTEVSRIAGEVWGCSCLLAFTAFTTTTRCRKP